MVKREAIYHILQLGICGFEHCMPFKFSSHFIIFFNEYELLL